MEIKKGDRVKINSLGLTIVGEVLSAVNYKNYFEEKDNWYIEIISDSNEYHYWKQKEDGGEVRKLKKNKEK